MDSRSKDTLLAIEQNSNKVTYLQVGAQMSSDEGDDEGVFNSRDSNDYDRLGTAIGNNTNLAKLEVSNLYDNVTLCTTNESFYDGIRRNMTIYDLVLSSIDQNKLDVAYEVLKVFRETNGLSKLLINTMPLVNSGEQIMADILRGCTNLREILYIHSRITDDQLLPMVEAIRGHHLIEKLDLRNNYIGNAGCEALATLRNLTYLDIADNRISNEGMISIANSLTDNSYLRELSIHHGNQIDLGVVADDFSKALCNTSSINAIYSSNHTLETINTERVKGVELRLLLELNKSTRNKRHVAIKKILLYYTTDFDMEPLFDLSVEEDDSGQDLKALPHVISWFETAKETIIEEEAIIGDSPVAHNNLDIKKISAIYQFVTAMPMLFVTASHGKGGGKKRKRSID